MNKKLISIVVPMYFEEKVVEECYKRLTASLSQNDFNYEIIFVNDGSRDKTLEILEKIAATDPRIRVISLSRNFGHQNAVTAGIDKSSGDAVVIIDADLQDPPELIPEMVELWKKGYHVVYGKRKKREGENFFKLFSAKAFYRILNKMSTVKIPMDTGDFRLIDKKVVEAMKKMPEQNRFLRGMSSWIGFNQIPLEYERKERFAGDTKYPLKKMLQLAFDGIFSFSLKPVKIIEFTGLLMLLFSFISLLYFLTGAIAGFRSLSLYFPAFLFVITFLSGIQLLSIGVVGEYIGRIYDNSKRRPLYIIDKEISSIKNLDKKTSENLRFLDNEVISFKKYGAK